MRLSIVGATGLVGKTILKVLEEFNVDVSEFIPVASKSSLGKTINFNNREYSVVSIQQAIEAKPDIVIFSAGSKLSLEHAECFAKNGTYVIDNSSAWRMFDDKKLIVPEVNINQLTINDKIIANPNCSTIQLVAVLYPLHLKYKIKRVIVSTYQSVTGSGILGINQLMSERKNKQSENNAYPHKIDLNCIPHGGDFLDNAYTQEEWKLVNETRKIMSISDLAITATVVRVPVVGGHSESVNIEFDNKPNVSEVENILKNSKGIIVQDNIKQNIYPMPIDCQDKNEIFVGRIRSDNSCENAINLWICADNLRKGAATNAVQIALYVYDKFVKNGKEV